MLLIRDHYINGQWVRSNRAPEFRLVDPSTEEVFARMSLGGQPEIDRAVECARRAFIRWKNTSREKRLNFLKKILELYDKRTGALASAISQEIGCPIDFALSSQVAAGSSQIKNAISVFERFEFEHISEQFERNRIIYEPIGVCGLITPWNWPMNQIILKVLPALAAGNTVILKPSELAPVSAGIFAEVINEAGLPNGVFNMVQGTGLEAGHFLSKHPDVSMVSFTGSKRAGIDISKTAADTIKRVTLELGGKGANIIFADADPYAVERGVRHCFRNSGQSCNAPTRMLIERSIYEQAVETAVSVANMTVVDLSSKTGSHIGPVISQEHHARIQSYIKSGIDEGANLAAGGLGLPDGFSRGYFVKPTIFSNVQSTMTIAREEIFGPILVMMPFDSENEAIQTANDTNYGLANYVQTSDLEKADRIARELRSGVVEVNGRSRCIGTPFGGYNQSGNGREGGSLGFKEYLEIKVITCTLNTEHTS